MVGTIDEVHFDYLGFVRGGGGGPWCFDNCECLAFRQLGPLATLGSCKFVES